MIGFAGADRSILGRLCTRRLGRTETDPFGGRQVEQENCACRSCLCRTETAPVGGTCMLSPSLGDRCLAFQSHARDHVCVGSVRSVGSVDSS